MIRRPRENIKKKGRKHSNSYFSVSSWQGSDTASRFVLNSKFFPMATMDRMRGKRRYWWGVGRKKEKEEGSKGKGGERKGKREREK